MEKRYITTILKEPITTAIWPPKSWPSPQTLWRRLKEYGIDPESSDYLIS